LSLANCLTAFAFDASAYEAGRDAAFGDSHRAKLLGRRAQRERERERERENPAVTDK
jgi:hypothetical protein